MTTNYSDEDLEKNYDSWQEDYVAKKALKEERKFDSFRPLYENFERLKPNQQKVLELIIQGHYVRDIAAECKINEATIYRWLQQDNFSLCLKNWQKRLMIEADYRVKQVIFKGLSKLEYVLDNPNSFDDKEYIRAIEISLKFLQRGN